MTHWLVNGHRKISRVSPRHPRGLHGAEEGQVEGEADPGPDKTYSWGRLVSPDSATRVSDKWAHPSAPQSPLL